MIKVFSAEIVLCNEKGQMQSRLRFMSVNLWHTLIMEVFAMRRNNVGFKKIFELVKDKIKPQKVWMPKIS